MPNVLHSAEIEYHHGNPERISACYCRGTDSLATAQADLNHLIAYYSDPEVAGIIIRAEIVTRCARCDGAGRVHRTRKPRGCAFGHHVVACWVPCSECAS